jgi:hypothetical protein
MSLRFSLAVLVSCAGTAAFAEKVTEPATSVTFEAKKMVDGRAYTLVGAGVRKKLIAKVYAMGMYAEDVEAKRAFPSLAIKAGGSDKAKLTAGDRAQEFLIWGAFNKIAVLHFVRDVDGAKVREAFAEGLADELGAKAAAELRDATEAFLRLCERDVKSGDELMLHTAPDGHIDVTIDGEQRGAVQNTKLVRAIWSTWLGSKPVAKELRGALVDRIDELGH